MCTSNDHVTAASDFSTTRKTKNPVLLLPGWKIKGRCSPNVHNVKKSFIPGQSRTRIEIMGFSLNAFTSIEAFLFLRRKNTF